MPIEYNNRAQKELQQFPERVRQRVHVALAIVEAGDIPPTVEPLRGFHGGSVLEVRIAFDGDAYRVIFSIEGNGIIYVVHAFKKKSTTGIATPKHELELVRQRLKDYRG